MKTDDQVTITVKDNGVGFDPELAGNLFKPFQRLHHQHDFQGHGMGLANVKKIVERHHGIIEARKLGKKVKALSSLSFYHGMQKIVT